MLLNRTDVSLDNRIGRYRLIAEIARGGMGIVYIAAAQGPAGFSKLVAIKELKPDLVQDSSFLTMFLDEARIAARLNHPNIVQTNDVDEAGGRHFIAMEYLEGRSLYNVVQRFAPKGGFPLRLAVSVLRDVLAALDYAHELADVDGRPFGFVHRDVSPQNIFLTFDGHTKVIDFGIAKARDSSIETKTGVLKGRVSYMAPEQLTHRADRRSDVFSVGAILGELITGRRLWQGMHELEILAHLTRADIPPLPARPDAPAALVAIARTALAGRPEDRYATAAEMRDALDDYLWANGGAPQARELAGKLLEEFGAARHKQRELIEKAVARLQNGDSEKIEIIPVSDGTRTGFEAAGAPGFQTNTPGSRVSLPAPEPGGFANEVPSLLRKHRHLAAASAAIAILLGVIIGLAFRNGPAPEARPAAVAPAAAQMPAAAMPSAPRRSAGDIPEMILLSVSVSPPQARVVIDGETMPSNPFLGRFPRSEETHRIRAVAPGYVAKERLVTFAENVMLDLSLNARPAAPAPPPVETTRRREPSPGRHASAPAHSPAPAPAPVAAAPSAAPALAPPRDIQPRNDGDGPRRRAIDSTNPYGDDK